MAYFWSTWLADALRADPVLAPLVVEIDGWQTRGRPPAQFSYLPSGTVGHHTACMCNEGHDPASCIRVILAGNASAPGPIAQLLTTLTPAGVRWNGSNCDPRVYVLAAGRANHAGAGDYRWGAPSGNGSSVGEESCGPPAEGWPPRLVEIRARVHAAILRWNGWPIDNTTIHWEYARPLGRKIDPSGPWSGQPALGRLAHWSPDVWRAEIARYLTPAPAPLPPVPVPPPPPGDDVDRILYDLQPGWFITDLGSYAQPVSIAKLPGETDTAFFKRLKGVLRVYKHAGIQLDESRGDAGVGDAFLLDRATFLPIVTKLAKASGF